MGELYPRGVILTDDPRWAWQDGGRKQRLKKVSDLNEAIDRSSKEGGVWEKGTFTVPTKVSEERVQLLAYKYVNKFGNYWEERGFRVKGITRPRLDTRPLPVEPDRRRYIMYAFVSRRPVPPVFDIPDKFVPEMQKAGLRLLE